MGKNKRQILMEAKEEAVQELTQENYESFICLTLKNNADDDSKCDERVMGAFSKIDAAQMLYDFLANDPEVRQLMTMTAKGKNNQPSDLSADQIRNLLKALLGGADND